MIVDINESDEGEAEGAIVPVQNAMSDRDDAGSLSIDGALILGALILGVLALAAVLVVVSVSAVALGWGVALAGLYLTGILWLAYHDLRDQLRQPGPPPRAPLSIGAKVAVVAAVLSAFIAGGVCLTAFMAHPEWGWWSREGVGIASFGFFASGMALDWRLAAPPRPPPRGDDAKDVL